MYISLLAIAVGLSADAFAVTLSDMLCYRNLPMKKKMLLPMFFGIFQGVMPLVGYFVGALLGEVIESFDHWIAFALLAILGVKMIIESIKEMGEEEKSVERQLSYGEMITQSIATSIDAMAVGITLAIVVELPIYVSAPTIAVVTYLLCLLGVGIASKLGRFLKNKAGIVGGIILVAIGVKILIEHLIGA